MLMMVLNQILTEKKACISYLGSFNNDMVTEKLISISEDYIESSNLKKLQKKISFLITECFQNIIRHTQKNDSIEFENYPDLFQINILEDRVVLTSCNLIQNKNISNLENKILYVNSLEPTELKNHYQNVLNNSGFSEKGGAGLGIIQMARKSSFPLKYSFKDIGSGYHLFFFSIEITLDEGKTIERSNIIEIEHTYNFLTNKNISIAV